MRMSSRWFLVAMGMTDEVKERETSPLLTKLSVYFTRGAYHCCGVSLPGAAEGGGALVLDFLAAGPE